MYDSSVDDNFQDDFNVCPNKGWREHEKKKWYVERCNSRTCPFRDCQEYAKRREFILGILAHQEKPFTHTICIMPPDDLVKDFERFHFATKTKDAIADYVKRNELSFDMQLYPDKTHEIALHWHGMLRGSPAAVDQISWLLKKRDRRLGGDCLIKELKDSHEQLRYASGYRKINQSLFIHLKDERLLMRCGFPFPFNKEKKWKEYIECKKNGVSLIIT